MNTGVRIAVFAAALAATFGTAYGVGAGVGPVGAPAGAEHAGHAAPAGGGAAGHAGHENPGQGPAAGGLQVSEGGYTLSLESPRRTSGQGELKFSVKDTAGRPVTAFKTEHGKELHFIVASRDLTVYRHLHPVRAADGTWSTPSTSRRRAATRPSPTSPPPPRAPRASPSARTCPSRVPTPPRRCPRRRGPPRWTATGSTSRATSPPARPAS